MSNPLCYKGRMINTIKTESNLNQTSTGPAATPALLMETASRGAIPPAAKTSNEPLTNAARPIMTKPKLPEKSMPPKPTEKPAPVENRNAEKDKAHATRDRELEAAISSITKAYGEGSIMRLGAA